MEIGRLRLEGEGERVRLGREVEEWRARYEVVREGVGRVERRCAEVVAGWMLYAEGEK
jgi:hypothetical protein